MNSESQPYHSSEENGEDFTRHDLTVPDGHHEQLRIDKYITQFILNATRNKVQDAIKNGWIRVNGLLQKASYRVQPGDHIVIIIPKSPPPEARPERIPLSIVYEDDDLIVIDKPAGMVVHPSFGNWTGTLVNALLYHTQIETSKKEEPHRPGIVHRLDKDTSGLLVVAKNDYAQYHLSNQFLNKSVGRVYRALVWGIPKADEGTITKNIARDLSDRKKMAVFEDERGKNAITHYKVIQKYDHLALLDVKLETGRTHQIRVHFSWMGHPILGDRVYGGDSVRYGPNTGNRKSMFQNIFSTLQRQYLHARLLSFEHPVTGERKTFESNLPPELVHIAEKLDRYCL